MNNQEFMMKVNFIIAGTQKGGTTALVTFLSQHPYICVYLQNTNHPLQKGKEPHFFDEDFFFSQSPPVYHLYHKMFPDPGNKKIIGESTPIYMYWESVPKRIREYNPNMKLIFILRNPIDRAFSHYIMEKKRGTEPLSFFAAIRNEEKRIAAPLSQERRIYSYVDRGYYSKQIRRMLQYFPKKQMLFLKTEDLRFNHKETIYKVYEFLNVKKIDSIKSQIIFSNKYPKMNDNDRKFLIEKYKKEIDDLEELLGRDCSSWRE